MAKTDFDFWPWDLTDTSIYFLFSKQPFNVEFESEN